MHFIASIKHLSLKLIALFRQTLWIPPRASSRRKSASWLARILLCFLLVTAIVVPVGDYYLPIIGNAIFPARAKHPPTLPYGLHLVDTMPMLNPAAVDVIFVHGLGSFPDTTWIKRKLDKGRSTLQHDDISWIRDFLPEDLPQARLIFFNYDSTYVNDAPHKDLQEFGREFLDAFENSHLRGSIRERRRHIVFLAHSYGGLVVKEALTMAQAEGDRYSDLMASTHGIIFLGTPHFGTAYSEYAYKAVSRLRSLGSNPDILLPLRIDSPYLKNLQATFENAFCHLEVVNCYETKETLLFPKPLSGLGFRAMIVPKESATFASNCSKTVYNISIDTDHSGLNKFDSKNDDGYIRVKQVLLSMIRHIIEERRKKQDDEHKETIVWHPHHSKNSTHACSKSPLYIVEPQTVRSFTARQSLMGELQQSFSYPSQHNLAHSVALFGRGGTGKSQLGLQYVEANRHRYDPIIWIDAHSLTSAATSYAAAFERLNLDVPPNLLDESRRALDHSRLDWTTMQQFWAMNAVKTWLESREEHHCEWLVILDQADELFILSDIMPRGPRGSVLITSRDANVVDFTDSAIYVGDLTTDEAIELLLYGIGKPTSLTPDDNSKDDHRAIHENGTLAQADVVDGMTIQPEHSVNMAGKPSRPRWRLQQEQAALAIINILGKNALALDVANSYILQHDQIREDISLYLDFFQEGSIAYLDHASPKAVPQHSYDSSVSNVFETSLVAAKKVSNYSEHILCLFAVMGTGTVQDRIFFEASWTRAYIRKVLSEFNPFVYFLKLIGAMLGSFWGIRLVIEVLDRWRKPTLLERHKKYARIVLVVTPLIGDAVYALVNFLVAKRNVAKGNIVQRSGHVSNVEIVMVVYLCAMYNLPRFSQWLLQLENETIPGYLQTLPKLMAASVLFSWLWASFYYGLDTAVEQHASILLGKLELSSSSLANFNSMLRGLQAIARDQVGWRYPLEIVWTLAVNLVLQAIVYALSILVWLAYTFCISWLIAIMRRFDQTIRVQAVTLLLHVVNTPVACSLLCFGVGYGLGMAYSLAGLYDWIPWEAKANPERPVEYWVTNALLEITKADRWDIKAYTDALATLTRFDLVRRVDYVGYEMHPMVQWWARNRLQPPDQAGWAGEAYRILGLAYQSVGCWDDVYCQQLLVPHLVEVASFDAMHDGTRYWRLKAILKMLYRSLVKIDKFVGPKMVNEYQEEAM